jgi:hypothetical protein
VHVASLHRAAECRRRYKSIFAFFCANALGYGVQEVGGIACYAMSCHAMPCHAMRCHAMPCYAVRCHAVPCCEVGVVLSGMGIAGICVQATPCPY